MNDDPSLARDLEPQSPPEPPERPVEETRAPFTAEADAADVETAGALDSTPGERAAPLESARAGSAFGARDWLLLLLLAGSVALCFWRILTPNPADRAQFPPGDFTDQFYAFRLYEARALAQGRLPLWSENYNSGHPFLADIQSAVFYPIALANTYLNVVLWNGFSLFALELEALLHIWLAGAFMYLFARRVLYRASIQTNADKEVGADAPPEQVDAAAELTTAGVDEQPDVSTAAAAVEQPEPQPARFWRAAAFVAALVFAFGGYLTSYPPLQLAILETAAWLPLALFFIDRATEPPPVPTSRRRRRGSPARGGLPRGVIAAGIVLGIAALAGHPQTFLFVAAVCAAYYVFRRWQLHEPNWAFVVGSLVNVGVMLLIAFGAAAIQLVPAVEYQQLSTREALSFADAAKGLPTLDVLQFILPGYASAFASPLYVGILPLWLALFGLLRRGRERVFWGLLALAALLLSFGFYVFAYVLFYLFVPGASLFRQQERSAFIVSFALALLAGYGMFDLASGINRARATRLFGLLPAGVALTLTLLIAFFVAGAQNPEGRLAFLGDRAGLMLIQFALASLLVGLYLRRVLDARVLAALAIPLILFDLWSVNEPANKGRVQDRFADIPFEEYLKSDADVFRVAADDKLLPGHFGIATGLEEVGGISPLRLARYDALLHLPPQVYLPLLNTKYVITREVDARVGDIAAQEDDLYVVGVYGVQPRAWFVARARVEPDDAAALTALAQDFPFAEEALVAAVPPFFPDTRSAGGIVALAARSAERMAFDVNTPADGLLVVSENYYPGWRAAVDGTPVEILRADLTLRAVPVPAGEHRVEMWYDPLSFKIGAALSAITLALGLVALALVGTRR